MFRFSTTCPAAPVDRAARRHRRRRHRRRRRDHRRARPRSTTPRSRTDAIAADDRRAARRRRRRPRARALRLVPRPRARASPCASPRRTTRRCASRPARPTSSPPAASAPRRSTPAAATSSSASSPTRCRVNSRQRRRAHRVASTKDVVVKTGSGDVDARRPSAARPRSPAAPATSTLVAGGRALVAKTGSGNVTVGAAPADLRITTASGDIRIDAVDEGEVRAKAASGDIQAGVRAGDRGLARRAHRQRPGRQRARRGAPSRRADERRCACSCRRSAATSSWPGSDRRRSPAWRPSIPARRLSWGRWAGCASAPGARMSRRWPTGSTSTASWCGWRRATRAATRCAPARCASATPTRWSCRGAGRSTTAARPTPRLFRTAPVADADAAGAGAAASRRRRRRAAEPDPAPSQLGARRRAPSAADEPATAPSPRSPASRSPTTTPTPPWPSRGCRRSTSSDDLDGVLAARSPLLARAFRGTDRPALMHTTVDAVHRRRRARRPVRAGRDARPLPGVDAPRPPRRGRSSPTTAARRGASSCGPGSGRSPARSSCAWCAPSTSPAAASASSASRTTSATTPSGSSTATVDAGRRRRDARRPS